MTDGMVSQDAVVIERSFDAPIDLIWQMWTEPEHFSAWYGPEGASIPVAEMDVRVGGTRLVCMEVRTPGGPMTPGCPVGSPTRAAGGTVVLAFLDGLS